jgi:hypothetical protein
MAKFTHEDEYGEGHEHNVCVHVHVYAYVHVYVRVNFTMIISTDGAWTRTWT